MRLSLLCSAAAKFAVKGFTEALINDFAVNAPHLKCAVVMPGHIATDIAINSQAINQGTNKDDLVQVRERHKKFVAALKRAGATEMEQEAAKFDAGNMSDEQLVEAMSQGAKAFRDNAPLSADGAATIILDGVRSDKWRILVGEDAKALDQLVRKTPESAYDANFFQIATLTAEKEEEPVPVRARL
jgi:short-subunit dehydrogenase